MCLHWEISNTAQPDCQHVAAARLAVGKPEWSVECHRIGTGRLEVAAAAVVARVVRPAAGKPEWLAECRQIGTGRLEVAAAAVVARVVRPAAGKPEWLA